MKNDIENNLSRHQMLSQLSNLIFNTDSLSDGTGWLFEDEFDIESFEEKVDPPWKSYGTIWRYKTFDRFDDIINDSALWFANTHAFDDNYESRYPMISEYSLDSIKSIPGEEDSTYREKQRTIRDFILNNVYINCWHKAEDESPVMWEQYRSKNAQDVVAIRSSIPALKISLVRSDGFSPDRSRLYSSKISYRDDQGWAKKYSLDRLKPFLEKRSIHKYENEFRTITDMTRGEDTIPESLKRSHGYLQPVDLKYLINEVIVSPWSDDDFLDKVSETVKQAGLDIPVSHSNLDPLEGIFMPDNAEGRMRYTTYSNMVGRKDSYQFEIDLSREKIKFPDFIIKTIGKIYHKISNKRDPYKYWD
jgi:hypothetical protein